MFTKLLVFALATVVLARPDVSHLKTVQQYTTPATSYDVPISSVDDNYFVSKYYRYGEQRPPSVNFLPPFVYNKHYTSGNVLPLYVSNAGSNQYGLLGQYGLNSQNGQGYYVSGSSLGGNNQGVNFVSQQGQGLGQQGVHFVNQQGQGLGQQGINFVNQQGQGAGQGLLSTQFVSQPVQHEIGNTQFISRPVQVTPRPQVFVPQAVQVTQRPHVFVTERPQVFVTQPVHVTERPQVFGTHFVSQGHGQSHGNVHGSAGHVNVQGALGQHGQQYVKNEERVYYFSAPEELQHKTRVRINVIPNHSKKTNVIFVNAPSVPQVIPEVVVPNPQIIEDKTKVVVLVKEHDQFVPITVQQPLPINQGKAEVFVVKYHDENDAAHIVSGGGNVYGSTFVQQDQPTFVNTVNANVLKHSGVGSTTVLPRFESDSSSFTTSSGGLPANIGYGFGSSGSNTFGSNSVNVVSTTPKIESFTIGGLTSGQNVKGGSTFSKGSSSSSGSFGSQSGGATFVGTGGSSGSELKGINVVGVTPTVASFGFDASQQQSGVGSLGVLGTVGSNAGGKQINTYEVKTIETVKNVPTVSTSFDFGGQDGLDKSSTYAYGTASNANQHDLSSRFGGDSGLNQGGYSIQTTDFVHNVPSSDSISYDNLDQIKKFLGKSGIEIVSVSKGTLEASADGPHAQDSFFKSLGLNSESFQFSSAAQDGNTVAHTLELNDNARSVADLPLQQIQIGNDVADIISGSTLSS